MGGINIAGRAVVEPVEERYVPVIGNNGDFVFAIPIGGSPPSYIDLACSHIVPSASGYWSNPCVVQPDAKKFVCDMVANTGSVNELYVLDVEADSATLIATEPNGLGVGNPGVNAPMYPNVHPDGTQVIYRRHWPAVADDEVGVLRVNIDGTGGTTLWSGTTSDGNVTSVLYSYDGTKIAFRLYHSFGGADDDLVVMDADGSNFSIVATADQYIGDGRYGLSWANTSNVLAFVDGADIRTINADGTGDTVIYTDPDPKFGVVGPTKWWSPDDSAIAYMQYETSDPNPKGTLGTIDAAGGGFTAFSPSFKIFGGSRKFQPQVFDERVWCQPYDASPSPSRDYILSCLFDGSDSREEAFWLWADTELYSGFFFQFTI